MQGLYKKVLKGVYPKIPSQFSPEMGLILKKLLTVNPAKRPSCEEILEINFVAKKLSKLFPEEIPEYKNILLTTIRCPKNLMYLTDRLPNSCYYEDSINTSDSKTLSKSHHGLAGPSGDTKHTISFMGSKKTKASSSGDSQYVLPKIKKNGRNKIHSISKDHNIQKNKIGIKKSASDIENNLTQEVHNRISTISPDIDDYENDFESEKEVKIQKTPGKSFW